MRKERGQSFVEFSLVLTLVLIILSGLVDVARFLEVYLALNEAVNNAGRYAAIYPQQQSEIQRIAADVQSLMLGGGTVDVQINRSQGACENQRVVISAQTSLDPVTPFASLFLTNGQMAVRVSESFAVLRCERS